MSSGSSLRRLRGIIGNALVWGAGFGAATLALFAGLRLVGIIPASVPWTAGLELAVRGGVIFTIAGGAFSTFVTTFYRGRRLRDISWWRFAVGGGIVTGAFLPLFLQLMNLLSGQGLVPWHLVTDDAVLGLVFGTAASGITLKVAQLAAGSRLESADEPVGLPPADDSET